LRPPVAGQAYVDPQHLAGTVIEAAGLRFYLRTGIGNTIALGTTWNAAHPDTLLDPREDAGTVIEAAGFSDFGRGIECKRCVVRFAEHIYAGNPVGEGKVLALEDSRTLAFPECGQPTPLRLILMIPGLHAEPPPLTLIESEGWDRCEILVDRKSPLIVYPSLVTVVLEDDLRNEVCWQAVLPIVEPKKELLDQRVSWTISVVASPPGDFDDHLRVLENEIVRDLRVEIKHFNDLGGSDQPIEIRLLEPYEIPGVSKCVGSPSGARLEQDRAVIRSAADTR
jgi:hypothetical protein